MLPSTTAVVLIGYQRDYFAVDGALHDVIATFSRAHRTLPNTLDLLERVAHAPLLLVATPIVFTENYEEIADPVGVLHLVKERRAFQAGQPGAQPIPELAAFADVITEIPGKRGLNAFSNTSLDQLLRERGVIDVVLAGAVTSICIDSTARSAHEHGYRVSVLADCIASRSAFEHQFFCDYVFPLYADVLDRDELLAQLRLAVRRSA